MTGRRSWTFGTLLLAIALAAFFAVFLVYPVGRVLREAFFFEGRFTLRFFTLLAANPVARESFANSFVLALLVTALTTVVALPLARGFTRYRFRGQTLLNALLLAPMIMPPFVGAIGLKQLLARYGSLNLILMDLGWADPAHPIDWLGAGGFWGIVILETLNLYPIMFLTLSAALASLDPAMREAAQSLGARPARP
jgi:iron(III) transport system permease protein